MAKQIGDLATHVLLADNDLMLIRDLAAGVDKKIAGSTIVQQINREVRLDNTNVTILDNWRNPIILMTAGGTNKTVTLPTLADTVGKRVTLVKIDTGAGQAILDGEGSETIGGFDLTAILRVKGDWIEVINDGLTWTVIGKSPSHRVITTTTTLVALDDFVVCNNTASITVNLPTAANVGAGNGYHIKRVNTGLVTIDGNGTETIDGDIILVILHNDAADIVSDGVNAWRIM